MSLKETYRYVFFRKKEKKKRQSSLVHSFLSTQEIHSIYENSFNKLTERFYKNSSWPRIEQVAELLGASELPHLLYRELYYRHLFSRLSPSLDDRIDSWNNYLELFSFLTSQQHKLRFPHSWLFDLVDEFVWQAQSFNHYRAKVKKKKKKKKKKKNIFFLFF
jgi:translation initiation factor 3 subunit L